MSGMFYSLDEAAQKLNKSKDEIKELVKGGQIREFRDGPNILFKAEEVEALISTEDVSGPSEIEEPLEIKDETEIIEMPPDESIQEAAEEEIEVPELEPEEPKAAEEEIEVPELAPEEPKAAEEEIEIPELASEEPEPELIEEEMELPELAPEEPELKVEDEMDIPELTAEDSKEDSKEEEPLEMKLKPEEEITPHDEDDFIDFNSETAIAEIPEEDAEPKSDLPGDSLDDILLAPETGAPADSNDLSGLTDGDTALVGQGTSILGLTDNKEYDLTDDTMADTVILDSTKAGSGSAGLDEIEEDISLDSFGSGSGLLDLSLQADDTSLGGILDEIYTDESNEPGLSEPQEPELNAVLDADPEAAPIGLGGEEAITPQLAAPAMAIGVGAPELPPDSQSNILGILLFLPIVAVLYAVIVTVAGIRGILPSILTAVQGFIWFLMGGMALVAIVITVAAFMLTGERKSPVKKEKKVRAKKEKKPKVKKEKVKKPKKEKPPKVKKAKKRK